MTTQKAACRGAFLTALWFGISAVAQTPTGIILGTVEDTSGAVVPGAQVSAREVNTNTERHTVTNALGYYELPLLPPGNYQVEAQQAGFKKFVRTRLILDTDQKLEIRITLTAGDVKESIQVTGESPLLQTTASSVGQVVDNSKIVDLPTSNRNLMQLSNLVAGVGDYGADAAPASTGSVAFGRYNANGGMTNTNEFMLDGATAILANMNAVSIVPTIDAIAEFKIETNGMSAEYGRTGGAIINATYKSGTNNLHGTVYEFWKNRALNANTWLRDVNGQPKSFTNVNTFGYSLGGPVYIPKVFDGRNRLFFFSNYEGYRDVVPSVSLLTLPTGPQKTGDFSQLGTAAGAPILIYDPLSTALAAGSTSQYTRTAFPGNIIPASRIDPVAKNLVAYYPLPNITPSNTFTNTNNFLSNGNSYDQQNEWTVKIDSNLGDAKRLFVRYSQSAQGGGASNFFGATPGCSSCLINANPAGSTSPRGGGSSLFIYPKNAVVGYTQTISPTMILDLRYSINRQLISRLPQSGGFNLAGVGFPQQFASGVYYAQFPPISIQNYQGLGTPSNGDYLRRGDTTHSVQGSVTLLRGAHTIKAGGDTRMFRYADIQGTNITPSFSFNQTWTQQNPFASSATAGWGLASFLLGDPASGLDTIPASIMIQWFYVGGYIQDDWRVTKRLTLNVGMRYEVETPYTERYNRATDFNLSVQSAATQAFPGAVGGLTFSGVGGNPRYREPVDWHNFGPRFGLAYKIMDSLVMRAGYGIFHQPTDVYGYGASAFGTNGFEGDAAMVTTTNGGLTPSNTLSNPFPSGFSRPTGSSLGPLTFLGQTVSTQLRNVTVPYAQQYNLGFQYQVKSFLFDTGYVGSHGVHQIINYPLDQLQPSYFQMGSALNTQVPNPFAALAGSLYPGTTFSNPTISQGQLLRPYPQFADVQDQYMSAGNMNYNSVQIKVEHRFSKGFSLLTGYTFSKNIGNVQERYWQVNAVQNAYNFSAERSISPLDVPNRLTLAWLWELPFGKGQPLAHSLPSYANAIASGWRVTGSATFQNGQPLAISNPVNQLGFGAGSRPSTTGQSPALPSSQQTTKQWFNTSSFFVPAPYTFGNLGPYLPYLRGPGTDSWNASFFKDTRIKEKATLEFRAEFYNFFNHPIWGPPGTTVGTPTFGVVSGKTGPSSTATNATVSTTNNRVGQIALKIIF